MKQRDDLFYAVVKKKVLAHGPTVPGMRSIFVSDDSKLVRELKAAMADSLPHAMRDETANIDDWTVIGDASYVKDRLAEYIESLNVTHFIARGRFPSGLQWAAA